MKRLRKVKSTFVAYTFLAPSLIGLAIFTLFPVLLSLVTSFSTWNFTAGLSGIQFTGIKNFTALFGDQWFLASLKNNLIYTVVTVPVTMAIALILATVVEQYVYGKNFIRLLIFIPNIISGVVVSYIWRVLLSNQGALNTFISWIFGPDLPQWLGDPHWAFPAIMLMGIWSGIGYVFILYMAGLQNISESLYEAAKLDGAGGWKQFIHITIPMIRPVSFFILITQMIFSFRVFTQIQILTHGGPGTSTSVLAYYIYVTAFQYYKMGYAAAMTWVVFIIIMIFTLIQWRYQNRGDA